MSKLTDTSEPLVSVIVLTYNQRDTICRTLESILEQQTTFDYEVVVSDDGSTDGTVDVIKRIASLCGHIRLLHDGKNRGIPANYFYALSYCRGRYIADCAGDDYWVGRDSLQRKVDLLEAHPDVGMVHTQWGFSGGYDEIFDPEPWDRAIPVTADEAMMEARHEDEEMDGRALLPTIISRDGKPIIHLSTALYRRSVLAEAMLRRPDMINKDEFGCEDMPVVMAICNRSRLMWLPDVTLGYDVGGNGITSERNPLRQARYYKKFIVMTQTLARYYGVPDSAVAPKIKAMKRYLKKIIRKVKN